jgi:hypothetical protein
MSSTVQGLEWYASTLRAWHLAVLRYAVTLDNADRLAVLRIAREIDRLARRRGGSAEFEFFRRTSAELCTAILRPGEPASAVLRQYLERIDDDRFKRVFAAAIGAVPRTVSPASGRLGRGNGLWKGLSSRSNHGP